MKIKIDDVEYEVIIDKKRTTRNTYIRVKDDLKIYVTCNILASDGYLSNLINDNYDNIVRMIKKVEKRLDKEEFFYYLGKKYDIVYLNNVKDIKIGEEKVFVNELFDLDKWYKIKAKEVFKRELDIIYDKYIYDIPYPSLSIRKMKTRWGVCNVKMKRVTLNLELIKKDIKYLDYVIVHELSHLLYANHSKDFWECVENNCSDYKKIRKELNYDA